MALMEGADEIDIVISVGKFLSGDYENMCEEIQELKDVCKEHHMKVILETGALKSASNIMKASILSMYSGADFIKTSTGKQQPAATPEAAYVMCRAIKEYYDKTGNKVGFKPAGGINTVNDAVIYYTIVKEVLGEEWLDNQWFRLGISQLVNLLLSVLKAGNKVFLKIEVKLEYKSLTGNSVRLLYYEGSTKFSGKSLIAVHYIIQISSKAGFYI